MADDGTEMIGEAGLTHDELRGLVDETLEGLRERGITSAVLAVHVNDGGVDHFRFGYRGGCFTARGLIDTAKDWIKGDLTAMPDGEEDDE